MKIVKGEYVNGIVKLLEEVPEAMGTKVLITFLEKGDGEQELLKKFSLQQAGQFIQEYLSDKREDLYREYLKGNDDKIQKRNSLSQQIQSESKTVESESMKVLKEFESLEDKI